MTFLAILHLITFSFASASQYFARRIPSRDGANGAAEKMALTPTGAGRLRHYLSSLCNSDTKLSKFQLVSPTYEPSVELHLRGDGEGVGCNA